MDEAPFVDEAGLSTHWALPAGNSNRFFGFDHVSPLSLENVALAICLLVFLGADQVMTVPSARTSGMPRNLHVVSRTTSPRRSPTYASDNVSLSESLLRASWPRVASSSWPEDCAQHRDLSIDAT